MPSIFVTSLPSPSSDRRVRALKTHGRRLLIAILVLIALLLALAFLPDLVRATGSSDLGHGVIAGAFQSIMGY